MASRSISDPALIRLRIARSTPIPVPTYRVSRPCGAQSLALELRPAGVVWTLARDGDVVDVAFAQACAGDAHELRLVMEFGEVFRADISHRRTQAAGELVHHVSDRALVGHLALDPLRHQLECILDVLLEVAVGGAARHRAYRAHAAIGLVGAALPQ